MTSFGMPWGALWILGAVSVALVALIVALFPYQETRTERVQLLPGNHTWVQELPTHESLPVALADEQGFLRIADGRETYVSLGGGVYIIYEVVMGGELFQYRQYYDRSLFLNGYDYSSEVNGAEIQDGVLISVLHRDGSMMKFAGVVLVLLAAGLGGITLSIRASRGPDCGEQNRSRANPRSI